MPEGQLHFIAYNGGKKQNYIAPNGAPNEVCHASWRKQNFQYTCTQSTFPNTRKYNDKLSKEVNHAGGAITGYYHL
jgi:hypothetical protein